MINTNIKTPQLKHVVQTTKTTGTVCVRTTFWTKYGHNKYGTGSPDLEDVDTSVKTIKCEWVNAKLIKWEDF